MDLTHLGGSGMGLAAGLHLALLALLESAVGDLEPSSQLLIPYQ